LSALLSSLSIRERVPQVEVSVADNAVALVLRVLESPSESDLQALRVFEASRAVRLYLQPDGLDSVRRLEDVPGEDPLRYGLPAFGLEIEFAPTDFIQVNGPINEALVTQAVQLLQGQAPEPRLWPRLRRPPPHQSRQRRSESVRSSLHRL